MLHDLSVARFRVEDRALTLELGPGRSFSSDGGVMPLTAAEDGRTTTGRSNVKIELLYFADCPHYEPTLELVRSIASDRGLEFDIEMVEVRDNDDARRLQFLGSPSLRVNGVDVEPTAPVRTDYALSCRVYGGGRTPPREMVELALAEGNAA